MDFISYTLSASPTQQKCLNMNDTLLVQIRMILGPVDGFDQDYAAGQGDKGGVILCGFLASHGDPLKTLQFAECLLDARAAFIECLGEKDRLLLGVRPV